jgi:hypothetical protein
VLARRWWAWVASTVVVVVTQVVMWNGWNVSGEWVPVTGTTALFAYSLYGLVCAVPVVLALVLLDRWVSLAAILAPLLWLGVWTGDFFSTSRSSTAAFAWFGPLVYGLPFVFAVFLIERVVTRLMKRSPVRR